VSHQASGSWRRACAWLGGAAVHAASSALLFASWLGGCALLLGLLLWACCLPLRLFTPYQTPLLLLHKEWRLGLMWLELAHLLALLRMHAALDGQVHGLEHGALLALEQRWRGAGRHWLDRLALQLAIMQQVVGGRARGDGMGEGGLMHARPLHSLRHLVCPVALHLATTLAVPYVATRGVLPRIPGISRSWVAHANLWGYLAYVAAWLAAACVQLLKAAVVRVHDDMYRQRYLVGRKLLNWGEGSAGASVTEQDSRESSRLDPSSLLNSAYS
ncbi:hypothetical protein QJQ45_025364, partial [Haematococcus lacustris]